MNPDLNVAKQGNDPKGAAERLGLLIDNITEALPHAVVLVAKIINVDAKGWGASPVQKNNTDQYNNLIPEVVQKRAQGKKHVRCVDFSTLPVNDDVYGTRSARKSGIHPTDKGYARMGKMWYDYIQQIPGELIVAPEGELRQENCPPDPSNGTQ